MSSEAERLGVHALVLAAGQGRRFGSDKRQARLPDGRTLLATSLANALAAFEQVSVVIREGEDARPLEIPPQVTVIRSARANRGMGASLADGVMAGGPNRCRALAILLGDMPWIPVDLMKQLGSQAGEERILLPTHQGHGGHPVIFGRRFLEALADLDGDAGARSILVQHRSQCRQVEVDEPGILRDVDHAEDVQRLRPD